MLLLLLLARLHQRGWWYSPPLLLSKPFVTLLQLLLKVSLSIRSFGFLSNSSSRSSSWTSMATPSPIAPSRSDSSSRITSSSILLFQVSSKSSCNTTSSYRPTCSQCSTCVHQSEQWS